MLLAVGEPEGRSPRYSDNKTFAASAASAKFLESRDSALTADAAPRVADC